MAHVLELAWPRLHMGHPPIAHFPFGDGDVTKQKATNFYRDFTDSTRQDLVNREVRNVIDSPSQTPACGEATTQPQLATSPSNWLPHVCTDCVSHQTLRKSITSVLSCAPEILIIPQCCQKTILDLPIYETQ